MNRDSLAMNFDRNGALLFAVLGAIFLALACASAAFAQTTYGADGRVLTRSHTDSQGTTTFYDAGGNVIGRSSDTSTGRTFYNDTGRRVGTTRMAPSKPDKSK